MLNFLYVFFIMVISIFSANNASIVVVYRSVPLKNHTTLGYFTVDAPRKRMIRHDDDC